MKNIPIKLALVAAVVAVVSLLWLRPGPRPDREPEPSPAPQAARSSQPASLPHFPEPRPVQQVQKEERKIEVDLRLVALSLSPEEPSASRATLQNVANKPGFAVMGEGDAFPEDKEILLVSIEDKRVLLDDHGEQRYLYLESEARLVEPPAEEELNPESILAEMERISQRGLTYEDMQAAVWSNVGRREEPHLLMQGRLHPAYGEGTWPDVPYLGLRVSSMMSGSFWEQLGLQVGDLVLGIDGVRIQSDALWSEAMPALYNNESISLYIQRGDEELMLETTTIPPR